MFIYLHQTNQTKKMDKEKEYLTEIQVQELLQVSHTTIHRWEKSGVLVPVKIGRMKRYKRSDINKLINESQKK